MRLSRDETERKPPTFPYTAIGIDRGRFPVA
jgi:hypothetical protein